MAMMNSTDPATMPAMAAPPGVVSDFNSPDSLLTYSFATVAICVFSITVALVLRLFTKIWVAKSMGWDDCEFTWCLLF